MFDLADRVGVTDCVRYLSHTTGRAVLASLILRILHPAVEPSHLSDSTACHQFSFSTFYFSFACVSACIPRSRFRLESTNLTWTLGEWLPQLQRSPTPEYSAPIHREV